MSSQNFNQSMSYFCGDSQATGLFMEAIYHGSNYLNPLNTKEQPNVINGTSLENILYAKNYSKSAKIPNMNDNDIHNQFVDFIIRTALFHREVDKSTQVSDAKINSNEIVTNGVKTMLKKQLKDILASDYDGMLKIKKWLYTDNATNSTPHITNPSNAITLELIGLTKYSSYFEYLNATCLLALLGALTTDVVPNVSNIEMFAKLKTIVPENTFDLSTSLVVNIKNMTIIDFINQLTGDCRDNKDANFTSLGNLCPGSFVSNAKTILNHLEQIYNTVNDKEVYMMINKNVLDVLVTHLYSTSSTILGGIPTLHDFIKNTDPNTNSDKVIEMIKENLKKMNTEQMRLSLETKLINALNSSIKVASNVLSVGSYTRVQNNRYATKLFENVFLNWENLDRDAREFYRVHLHLFKKKPDSLGHFSESLGWQDVNDMLDTPNYVKLLKRDEIRINLMKVDRMSPDVLFGRTLPFLPISDDSVKVWYTDAVKGHPVPLNISDLSETFFQDLYNCVYKSDTSVCRFNSMTLNIPSDFTKVEKNNADFSIADIMVIKNFIASRKQPQKTQVNESHSFESLFIEDMVSRTMYKRDESGQLYYVSADGKNVPYDGQFIKYETCLGSVLSGDNKTCSTLVRECLLSGDKNELSECMSKLQNANLFEVAHEEFENADPDVIVQILRTFGIGRVISLDPILGEMSVPQSFESWKDTRLNELRPALRNAILNDTKLCDYLKGAISFVTHNPAILNKNLRSQLNMRSKSIENDTYLKALGKTEYANLNETSIKHKLFDAQMFVKAITYPQIAITSRAHVTAPFNNVITGGGFIINPNQSLMKGGNPSWEDSIMRKLKRNGNTSYLVDLLMENLFSDMKSGGIPLNDSDYLKVKDGIKKLAHGEEKLTRYYSMLRALADLALFFKASGCVEPSDNIRELSLEDIVSRQDTLQYLYNNISSVQNCINENIQDQNSKCKELVGMYELLVGRAYSSNK